MKIEIKLTGADRIMELLKKLPANIVGQRAGPAQRALRAGAVVVQKQEIANLRVVTANQTSKGHQLSTGLLAENIVVTRGKPPSNGSGERYLVKVRNRFYKGRGGSLVYTLKTAQLLEYGSSQQQAEPYIRPAVNATGAQAIATIERELLTSLERLANKAGVA